MPHARIPRRRTPLALLVDHPLQLRITRGRLARDPAILHLGKVALEKVDLMLAKDARRIGAVAHHAKVVVHLALVDRRRRLWDELDAPHVLPIPVGGAVERELGALLGHGVGWVLVGGRQGNVLVDCLRAVDVVLVWSNLVAPRPGIQVRGCCESGLPC